MSNSPIQLALSAFTSNQALLNTATYTHFATGRSARTRELVLGFIGVTRQAQDLLQGLVWDLEDLHDLAAPAYQAVLDLLPFDWDSALEGQL